MALRRLPDGFPAESAQETMCVLNLNLSNERSQARVKALRGEQGAKPWALPHPPALGLSEPLSGTHPQAPHCVGHWSP